MTITLAWYDFILLGIFLWAAGNAIDGGSQ